MNFNVSQLLKERVGATRAYDIASEPVDLGELGVQAVSGHVRMTRTNRAILVDATLETHATAECSRCLEAASFLLHLAFAEEFFPSIDVFTGVPIPAPADAFRIDRNHLLDLDEAVRQYALTAAPMAPLCRPDCAGLCPRCGANLNDGPCDCREDELNPRLAALAAWHEEEGEQTMEGA